MSEKLKTENAELKWEIKYLRDTVRKCKAERDAFQCQNTQLRRELVKLRAELVEVAEDDFCAMACKHDVPSGDPLSGWWDTMSLSHVQDLGELLVREGVFERHPTKGSGRRQFYRRKENRCLNDQ